MNKQKLKTIINKASKETGLKPNQLYGLYALEQFLIKIESSPYKEDFILKGGYLLSSKYGLSARSTRDLDASIRNQSFIEEKINEIVNYVVTPSEDGIEQFEYIKLRNHQQNVGTEGFELRLNYIENGMRIPLMIDLTSGEESIDIVEFSSIPLLFEEESNLTFASYSTEQILVDKFYATMSYGKIDDSNTRMKDFYDIHLLSHTRDIDYSKIFSGLEEIMERRDNYVFSDEYIDIVDYLENSKRQKAEWEKYQDNNPYSQNIEFSDVMYSLHSFTDNVLKAEEEIKSENIVLNDDELEL